MPSKYITEELIVQKAAEEVRNGVFSSFCEAERVRNFMYPARRLNAPSKTSHRELPASPRICGSILRKNKSSLNGLPSWINYSVARLFSFSKFRQTGFSTRPGGTMVLGEIAQSLSRTNGLSSLCGDIRSSSCGRIINLEKARITAESNAIISQ
jgi:hypothetical protein